jgi:hypothetical protein
MRGGQAAGLANRVWRAVSPRSESRGSVNHFTGGARDQRGQDAKVQVLADKVEGTVGESAIATGRVEAL